MRFIAAWLLLQPSLTLPASFSNCIPVTHRFGKSLGCACHDAGVVLVRPQSFRHPLSKIRDMNPHSRRTLENNNHRKEIKPEDQRGIEDVRENSRKAILPARLVVVYHSIYLDISGPVNSNPHCDCAPIRYLRLVGAACISSLTMSTFGMTEQELATAFQNIGALANQPDTFRFEPSDF